ncbi:MAG: indolepyruvate ferredoxin oxidoreductase subunit beta [Candidatus Hodarchaeales archaeon]
MQFNIFACGVGGQGILSITDILALAAVDTGVKVRGSETHGMSQRFGTVFASVRLGEVYSTLIPDRSADVLIGMEPVEAIRYARYIGSKGYVIINTQPIPSSASVLTKIPYPKVEEILKALAEYTEQSRIISLNATKIAQQLGASIVQNMVLLGALSAIPGFPLSKESLIKAMKKQLKEKFHKLNAKAFEVGESRAREIVQ